MLKRIKRINSYTGHARFIAECGADAEDNLRVVGEIVRQADIPSPYHYSPTWQVLRWNGKNVTIRETAHKQYDVFEVPAEMIQPETKEVVP